MDGIMPTLSTQVMWLETELFPVIKVSVFCIGIATVWVLFLDWLLPHVRAERHVKMNAREREVHAILQDALCTFVEELYFREAITISERNELYRKLANRLDMPDLRIKLLPIPPDPDELKQQIKQRLRNNRFLHRVKTDEL